MKNISYVFLSIALLLFNVNIAQARTQPAQDGKISLTKEQIKNGLPEGIINPLPYPVEWLDSENIHLMKMSADRRESFRYNIKSGKMEAFNPAVRKENNPLPKIEGAMNPTYSPDVDKVAFTRDNDLYVYDMTTGKETRLTYDGSELILNGYASWVYYEEILGRSSRYKAFWWSPDSKKIAFYRFNNSEVPMFPIYDAAGQQGALSETRYPKAGEKNPTVRVGIIDLEKGREIVWADFNEYEDQYFGIPYWSGNSSLFIVPWLPRIQNDMTIYKIDPNTGNKESIYNEKQKTWIDWVEVTHFTDKGLYMVRDFEGWEQIYYLTYEGAEFRKITYGNNWDIRIEKVDEKKNELFYSARRERSTRRDLYRAGLKNKKIERLSKGDLTYNSILISPDSRNFISIASNAQTPSKLLLTTIDKKATQRTILDSKGEKFNDYKLAIPEIVFMTTEDGFRLPGSITLPVNMDPTKKYPVIVNIYGGPNSTQVMDVWRDPSFRNQWWANEEVIQITIDNRSSGHCARAGLDQIHKNLGEVELRDFIAWAEWLREKTYVNSDKIGITGFSYGGTMTVLALTDGAEYFKYGIAGGGVYDWMLYDSHYTERYMETPQTNPDGYKNTNVISRVAKYRGDKTSMLRLTHGTSDDNVHFQNTLQLIDALQKEGKFFELMIYPGGFHGYRGYQGSHSNKEDMIFWYKYLLEKELPEILAK